MDAIREVGLGKHFLGFAHTQANFENAFYHSPITGNNSYEQWEPEGSRDLAQRANASFKKQLAEYEAPALDVAVYEAILDYVNQRKGSFADSKVLRLPARFGYGPCCCGSSAGRNDGA